MSWARHLSCKRPVSTHSSRLLKSSNSTLFWTQRLKFCLRTKWRCVRTITSPIQATTSRFKASRSPTRTPFLRLLRIVLLMWHFTWRLWRWAHSKKPLQSKFLQLYLALLIIVEPSHSDRNTICSQELFKLIWQLAITNWWLRCPRVTGSTRGSSKPVLISAFPFSTKTMMRQITRLWLSILRTPQKWAKVRHSSSAWRHQASSHLPSQT